MDENMRYWGRFCHPPEGALKKIQGGRLSGMTDINPQWRMLAMTEVFGPVGDGWKYSLNDIKYEAGTDGQIVCIVFVTVMYRTIDGAWSEPIPGVGASLFIAKEKDGLRTNDEAPKMAMTDALSVAFKAIGVAADIYMRQMDTKYALKELRTQQSDTNGAEQLHMSPDEANKFIAWITKLVNGCDNDKCLKDLWRDQEKEIHRLKEDQQADVLSKFSERKSELRQAA